MIIDIPQEAIIIASILGLIEVGIVFGSVIWLVRRTFRVWSDNRIFKRRLAALA